MEKTIRNKCLSQSLHMGSFVCVWIWTREGSVNIQFRVRTAVIRGVQGACRSG